MLSQDDFLQKLVEGLQIGDQNLLEFWFSSPECVKTFLAEAKVILAANAKIISLKCENYKRLCD